jgi:prepilin-type N-terminal cleavage/methylation domain-containing protein
MNTSPRQPIRSNGAFTLIELLIVVAIIAILAAIAVPNFLEAQTRAKFARAKSDMRTIATALEGYRIDTNKYPEQGIPNGTGVFDTRILKEAAGPVTSDAGTSTTSAPVASPG